MYKSRSKVNRNKIESTIPPESAFLLLYPIYTLRMVSRDQMIAVMVNERISSVRGFFYLGP